jgi:uncharacterized protein YndB with AHSA1/START domain
MSTQANTQANTQASTGTVTLHRVLRCPAERVYAAFLTPASMAKWLPPHGYTCTVHAMDAVVGGRYQMSFTHVGSGHSQSFGGTYLELEPAKRLRYSAAFDDPNLPGQMQTTVVLNAVSCGVDVRITQEGIPAVIPTEACYLGWQESLQLLTLLVEADTPG